MSIDSINVAVVLAMIKAKSENKMAIEYFEDLENIRLSKSMPVKSVENVSIIVLIIFDMQSCYCLFKVCFTPSYNIKPFFPTYREWTKWPRKH
jgi:hypothetical protein